MFIISCKTHEDLLEADVLILGTFKSIDLGGSATVRYQVENIGDKKIRGWNIYFRVSMESGKQVQAFHGLTYDLAIDEISDKLLAYGKIPDHFDDVDKPITATLQLIEVY
jgi:hypothetical protein